jgi:uncharacterized protein
MNEPASLYVGKVMHARLRPRTHRFVYRIFMMLIDLERLDEADKLSRFFSVARFNLLSFRERDHLPTSEACGGLAERARTLFSQRQIDVSSCRILLLCLPRVLGYAFNPITVFYAVDGGGRIRGLIYEVRNTFGERHAYVAPAWGTEGPLRHELHKQFHVSPFLPMDLQYQFSVSTPGEKLAFRILEIDAKGPLLSAGFSGRYLALRSFTVIKVFFGLPLMTVKVILGIHFEAARLYLKGVGIHSHPRKRRDARLERT